MVRTYPRLSIEEFGAQLISSMDLDPVYVALRNCKWDDQLLKQWLLVYWCFYDVGVACWVAAVEPRSFWERFRKAAANLEPNPLGERWARGQERRHFRGKAALKAVQELKETYKGRPEGFVDFCSFNLGKDRSDLTCSLVMGRVQQHHLFGPWIAFKVADMLERVLQIPVSFSQAEVLMFDQPKESALMLWKNRVVGPVQASRVAPRDEALAITNVVAYLTDTFRDSKAPPLGDRAIGLQEVETILCKWKSHMNGHYPLWNDIDEIHHKLSPWAKHSDLAKEFLAAMPRKTA